MEKYVIYLKNGAKIVVSGPKELLKEIQFCLDHNYKIKDIKAL